MCLGKWRCAENGHKFAKMTLLEEKSGWNCLHQPFLGSIKFYHITYKILVTKVTASTYKVPLKVYLFPVCL